MRRSENSIDVNVGDQDRIMKTLLKTIRRIIVLLLIMSIAWLGLTWKNYHDLQPIISRAQASMTADSDVVDKAEATVKMAETDGMTGDDVKALSTVLSGHADAKPSVPSLDWRDWKETLKLPFTAKKTRTIAEQAMSTGDDRLDELKTALDTAMQSYFEAMRTTASSSEYAWRDRLGGKYDGAPSQAVAMARSTQSWSSIDGLYKLVVDMHGKYSETQSLLKQTVDGLHAAEAEAAKIQSTDGAETTGSIKAKIDEAAGKMGVQVVYTPSAGCQGEPGDGAAAIGYYCQGYRDSRNKVFVNTANSGYPRLQSDAWLLDAVKHELSHRSIMITCGTVNPKIAGSRIEAVTNSYAYAYYGANRERTVKHQEGITEYAADAETDAIAAKIHNGQCS